MRDISVMLDTNLITDQSSYPLFTVVTKILFTFTVRPRQECFAGLNPMQK